MSYTLVAGEYDGQDENIKVIQQYDSLAIALQEAKKWRCYHFCRVEAGSTHLVVTGVDPFGNMRLEAII